MKHYSLSGQRYYGRNKTFRCKSLMKARAEALSKTFSLSGCFDENARAKVALAKLLAYSLKKDE